MTRLGATILVLVLGTGCRPMHKPYVAQDLERQKLRQELQPYFDHPETIDYAVVKKHIIEKCQSCHSLESPMKDNNAIAYGANLTNYASLFNVFTPVVVKGDPAGSKLFQSIAVTQSMPPAMMGFEPLDGVRIKLLRLWILNCAVENKIPDEILTPDPDLHEKVRTCTTGNVRSVPD